MRFIKRIILKNTADVETSDTEDCTNSYQHTIENDVKSTYDNVQQPKHYILIEKNGINLQVRDVCTAIANRLQSCGYSGIFISDCVQLLQYLLRFDQKENDLQDLKKSQFYLEKMIHELESLQKGGKQ